MERVTERNQPILFRYRVPRTSDPIIPGRYCAEREMWLVPTAEGERLAIDLPEFQPSLQTKTATHTEQDDDPSLHMANMLQTKTDAQLEQEDQAPTLLLGMLQTKTEAGREAEDTAELLV